MRFGITLPLFCLVLSNVGAEEWPAWRGPRGDGTSTETGIPLRWSTTENIAWKTPIPGKGHSSPVVWGDRVFVTSCLEHTQQRVLLCLDRRDGKVLWQRVVVASPLEQKHKLNSYASSTPATDGKHVFVTFFAQPQMQVACYDFEGNQVWMKSPGKFFSRHGFCSPPFLYKDTVIINGDQDAEAWLVALDKATGAERWRTDRPNRTRSYCPFLLIETANKKQLVLSGSKCVASYDPDTGKQHWIIDGPTEQYVASLVYSEGLLFLTYGYPDLGLMAIRPDGTGDVTNTHVVWQSNRAASYVPSPIAHGPYFFVVSDQGLVSCLEAKTGKRPWGEPQRLGKHHSASPVAAEGRLYFPDDHGTTWVLKAGPTFEVLSKNNLEEGCHSSPAISGGHIFLRTAGHLWCIGRSEP